jgi:hypothetical protein
MALNLVKELRLEDAGLIDLFEKELQLWRAMARQAFVYAAGYIEASGAQIPGMTSSQLCSRSSK